MLRLQIQIGNNRQSIYTQGIHSIIHLYLFVSLKRSMALSMEFFRLLLFRIEDMICSNVKTYPFIVRAVLVDTGMEILLRSVLPLVQG